MVQTQTVLYTTDNSGGKNVKCIKALGGFYKRNAGIGDTIIVSIQNLRLVRRIRPGQIYLAIVVRTKKEISYLDGSYSKFGDNSVILLNNKKRIMGTRIFGPISKNLRKRKFLRLLLLANKLII